MYTHILVRYGDLTLKGNNRTDFINVLYRNMKKTLSVFNGLTIEKLFDRMFLNLNGNDSQEVIKCLEFTSGIGSYSPAIKVAKDIIQIKNAALNIINTLSGNTFKIFASRQDKNFILNSDQINREVAGEILRSTTKKVDVHNPEISLGVEIRSDFAYVFASKVEGLKGFPLGTGGKGLLMLSGGIDSPVAGFLMMKKGIKIEAIHFSSPPYTSDLAVEKVKSLLKELCKIQGDIKFYNVNFTALQLEIYKQTDSYAITIMRRMMYRLAEIIAKRAKCACIVNGESVGQVASQTLESMKTINNVTNYPIIRPLAIFEKNEIIAIAKQINTYAISILPYEDCCTIFEVKKPATKPKLKEAEFIENKFDFAKFIEEALETMQVEYIKA